jgi:hypothetical protein
MSVDVVNPPRDAKLQSSPVELAARVTIRDVPAVGANARFTVYYGTADPAQIDVVTDTNGIASLVLPLISGNYTWHVTAAKNGYPTIMSRPGSFSLKLTLTVEPLSPTSSTLALSPVDFKVRVIDLQGRPVESANVSFHVDSTRVGWSQTGSNGIAKLSAPVTSGMHTWFASANKGGEGGVSDFTIFVVGEASITESTARKPTIFSRGSVKTADLDAFTTRDLQSHRNGEKMSAYTTAMDFRLAQIWKQNSYLAKTTRMRSSTALSE